MLGSKVPKEVALGPLLLLTGKRVVIVAAFRVTDQEGAVLVFGKQQLLLGLYSLYLAEVPSAGEKKKKKSK